MTALHELLSRAHDIARKHPPGSPAKGRWLGITTTPDLIDKVKAEDAALREELKDAKANIRILLMRIEQMEPAPMPKLHKQNGADFPAPSLPVWKP